MNDFIAVAYTLFVKSYDEIDEQLKEQRTKEQPFVFITDLGNVLPSFEQHLKSLNPGDSFDIHIPPQNAFGLYDQQLVIELPLSHFLNEKGCLDEQFFFVGNLIPLSDTQGNTYPAKIKSINKKSIVVDLNHPKAGIALHFVGTVLEKRKATQEELDLALKPSGSCGGCCGGKCGNDCSNGCGGCK